MQHSLLGPDTPKTGIQTEVVCYFSWYDIRYVIYCVFLMLGMGLGSGRAGGRRAQGVSLTFVKVKAARDIDNSGDIIILGSVCKHRVASLAVTCTTQAKRVKRVSHGFLEVQH